MDYAPFYYLNTEDVIPEDAAYVIVGGSIKALPHKIFHGYTMKTSLDKPLVTIKNSRLEQLKKATEWICNQTSRFSSIAIVIKAGDDGSDQAAGVTGRIERDPSLFEEDEEANIRGHVRLILNSEYLAWMGLRIRKKFADAVNQITDDQMQRTGRLLDLRHDGVADSIHNCITNCVLEYKTGIAAVLELALWKANMNHQRDSIGNCMAGGGKRARFDAPIRDNFRRTCSADIVVKPVLSYLWGPHHRVDQRENRTFV